MSDNPWVVDNLKDFWFMNCPECVYKTKTENSFQDHAFENHPLSFVLFETYAKINPGSENNNCDDPPEIESVEQDGTNNFVVKFKKEEDKTNGNEPKTGKTLEEIMFGSQMEKDTDSIEMEFDSVEQNYDNKTSVEKSRIVKEKTMEEILFPNFDSIEEENANFDIPRPEMNTIQLLQLNRTQGTVANENRVQGRRSREVEGGNCPPPHTGLN